MTTPTRSMCGDCTSVPKVYDVLTASDGQSAYAEAVRRKPDVIMMDLELPGKSGFEVARDLKARPDTCAIPLIAATGYSHVKQLDLARASGFDAVMVKPCDPQSLVAEIRRLLARRSNDAPAASE